MPTTMRAVVLDRLGADAPFRVADLPTPEPGPVQVRIRVEAVGVNPVDVATRTGFVPLPRPDEFPLILGWDAAGVIDAVGADVTQWTEGQRVMGFSAHLQTQAGTYAEHIVLDVDDIAEQPPGWSSVQARPCPHRGSPRYRHSKPSASAPAITSSSSARPGWWADW